MSENYLSTTGNPKLAGICPRCGGQVYQGLTHQCSTSVTPTQQIVNIPLAEVNHRLAVDNDDLRMQVRTALSIMDKMNEHQRSKAMSRLRCLW